MRVAGQPPGPYSTSTRLMNATAPRMSRICSLQRPPGRELKPIHRRIEATRPAISSGRVMGREHRPSTQTKAADLSRG
jgi:hypothetical protein